MSAMRKLWKDPEFLKKIQAMRNPEVQPGSPGAAPSVELTPTLVSSQAQAAPPADPPQRIG